MEEFNNMTISASDRIFDAKVTLKPLGNLTDRMERGKEVGILRSDYSEFIAGEAEYWEKLVEVLITE